MSWVPFEVEGLRSKALQQAQANQVKEDGATTMTSDIRPEVTSGSELLKLDRNMGQGRDLKLQAICGGGIDEILQACVRPGVVGLAAEDGNDRSMVSKLSKVLIERCLCEAIYLYCYCCAGTEPDAGSDG